MDTNGLIKTATKFGKSASHIPMPKRDEGKKFLVLPESSKYIIEDILNEYEGAVEEIVNPKIQEWLNNKEFDSLLGAYIKAIEKLNYNLANHKLIEDLSRTYEKLGLMRKRDINIILDQVEDFLPPVLKEKLVKENIKK